MARAEFKLPDEFMDKLSRLGDKTDEIVPRVLEAGGEVVLARVRGNLQAVIGKNLSIFSPKSRSTGKLVSALGVSPTKLNREGNFDVKIGFAEPRSDGGSNAKIANVLEYGKHNQPARPFLKPAKSQSREACISAMKAKLEEEISNI